MNIDFVVKSPEGIPFTVKAPLGTSQDEVINRVKTLHSNIQKANPKWDVIQHIESNGNPSAVSKKGALGDMQTMPKTLTDPGYGVSPAKDHSPQELHRVGVDYWEAMKKTFNHPLAAAMAYNWGPGVYKDWVNGENTPGVKHPDFKGKAKDWSLVPQETKNYVNSVIKSFSSSQSQATNE
jgi:soluble lytic murein transglycosylase-like protein